MSTVAAVDIGGTSVRVALVSEGRIKANLSTPMKELGSDAMIDFVVSSISQLAEKTESRPRAVGIACAGLVEAESGIIKASPNAPFLNDVNLRDRVCEKLRLPTMIENDANAATLSELEFGGWGKPKVLITLTLGTGVGGGVAINGELLRGASNMAAEFGHLKVAGPRSRKCGCSRRGCLEAFAGARGMLQFAKELWHKRRGGDVCPWQSVKEIVAAAESGDLIAMRVLRNAGSYLGRGIAQLVEAYNPDVIALAGGVAIALPHFKTQLERAILRTCSFQTTRDMAKIVLSRNPLVSGVLGAAAGAERHLRQHLLLGRLDRGITTVAKRTDKPHRGGENFLCVHIGASSYSSGVFRQDGTVVSSNAIRCNPDARSKQNYQKFVEQTAKSVEIALDEAKIHPETLAACGVVVPVPKSPSSRRLGRAPALKNLRGRQLVEDIVGVLPPTLANLPVFIENDGNATCLAEQRFGGIESKDFVAIRLCTGIGCGLYLNSSLYRGFSGIAGEIGHLTVQPDGESCLCGNRGCLETVASGRWILDVARRVSNQHFESYIDVIDAAEMGAPDLLRVFSEMGRFLGIACSTIFNFLNPEMIVIGGPLAQAYPLFENTLEEQVKVRSFDGVVPVVAQSKLSKHSELLSALAVALESVGSIQRESARKDNQDVLRTGRD